MADKQFNMPSVMNLGLNFDGGNLQVQGDSDGRKKRMGPAGSVRPNQSKIKPTGKKALPAVKKTLRTASQGTSDSTSKASHQARDTPDSLYSASSSSLSRSPVIGPIGSHPPNSHLRKQSPSVPLKSRPQKKNRSNTQHVGAPERVADGGTKTTKLGTKKPVLPSINKYEQLLTGCLDNLPSQRSTSVRIFLSSTFSDMRAERNALATHAYPELKDFCGGLGLDFQVQDMRWGVNDLATIEHVTEQLCLLEIEKYQRLSRGPNFVAILGDRYGFIPLLAEIEAAEFNILLEMAPKAGLDKTELLQTWYRRDDNAVPPVYLLKPITCELEHFGNQQEPEKHHEARDTWAQVKQTLQSDLEKCAVLAHKNGRISAETMARYFSSVTHREIQTGILQAPNPEQSVLCFLRSLDNLQDDLDNQCAWRYMDTKEENTKMVQDVDQVANLKKQRAEITKKLKGKNCYEYTVPWHSGGIDPQKYKEHKKYLQKFCEDFKSGVKELVEKFFKEEEAEIRKECSYTVKVPSRSLGDQGDLPKVKGQGKGEKKVTGPFGDVGVDLLMGRLEMKKIVSDHETFNTVASGGTMSEDRARRSLHSEILHHLTFCKVKCEVFCGRKKEVEQVQKYLKGSKKSVPLIIHAASGTGKTAFSAYIAKLTKSWLGHSCVTIIRFLGTSAQSSMIRKVLSSVCHQICVAYNLTFLPSETLKMSKLKLYLSQLISVVSAKFGAARPLVIILDSVDQLEPKDGAYSLKWLPEVVPPHVHFVMSMISDIHNLLDNAKSHLCDTRDFIELGPIEPQTVNEFIVAYLQHKGRTVTQQQRALLKNCISDASKPLLMKLLLDGACLWKSFTPVDDIQLAGTITSAIGCFFQRLETQFCEYLVRYTLGFITVGKNGITEIELEDALSCTDEVLSGVYQYHDPPVDGIVRIPPLLWARIRHELGDYIAERNTFNKTTLTWYHRHFQEAATKRYASEDQWRLLHLSLVDIFAANEKICRSITLKLRKKVIEDADRQITVQPLNEKNLRKLSALLYHLSCTGHTEAFKKHTVCHFQFLYTWIKGFSVSDLLEECSSTPQLEQDEEICLVSRCLRYSLSLIQHNTAALPVQILGQLLEQAKKYPSIKMLCDGAVDWAIKHGRPVMLPTFGCIPSSSNVLKWYVQGPASIMCQSPTKSHILLQYTRSDNEKNPHYFRSLHLGRLQFSSVLQHSPKTPKDNTVSQCLFSHNSQNIYVLCKENLYLYSIETGKPLQCVPLNINNAALLNNLITVSSDDEYLGLAGVDRVALLENQSSSLDEPDFKSRRAMDFSGSIGISNFQFTADDEFTISTHTIQGKKQTIGAIVKWDFWSKELKTKVALPTKVVEGFMHFLPEDNVLCGCANGHIFIVDMEAGSAKLSLTEPVQKGDHLLHDFDAAQGLLTTMIKGKPELRSWDLASGTSVRKHKADEVQVTNFAVFQDGSHCVVADAQGSLHILDLNSGVTLQSIKSHENGSKMFLCLDGDQLYTCSGDRMLKLWDLPEMVKSPQDGASNEAQMNVQSLTEEQVTCFDVTPDGQHVIAGSRKDAPKVWNIIDGTLHHCMHGKHGKHGATEVKATCEGSVVLAFNKDSGTINTWDFESGEVRQEDKLIDNVTTFALTSDAKQMVIIRQSDSSVIEILDIASKDIHKTITLTSNVGTISSAIFSGNDDSFIILLMDKKAGIQGHCSYTIGGVHVANDLGEVVISQGQEDAHVASSSKMVDRRGYMVTNFDNGIIIGWHGDHDMPIWQPMKKECDYITKPGMTSWLRHGTLHWKHQRGWAGTIEKIPIVAISVSREQSFIASGAENGSIIIWTNVEKKEMIPDQLYGRLLTRGHSQAITSLGFSSDERHLVSGSKDQTIRLWESATGTQLTHINVHMQISHVTFTPDNLHIVAMATTSEKNQLMIFKAENISSDKVNQGNTS